VFLITIVLIHSPLVDSTTWNYLAPALKQNGYSVVLAPLNNSSISPESWWRQDVEAAVTSLTELSSPYILVGHSGAGPLLPLIGQRLPTPPAGYIFVDAGILWEPNSRLGMMVAEDEVWGTEFEAYLREGGTFPNWEDEQLADIIPNAEMRRKLIHYLRPKPLSFFTETVPVPAGWDGVPCAYLQLSDTYTPYATTAQAKGWVVERMKGHHFSMMTDPDEVANVLIDLFNLHK
jgi:pimeloyl-ACP methyl ester carboxylesterase